MPANVAQQHNLPEHWDPEILAAYLASVEKEKESGMDEDEAMSSDEEMDDSFETESSAASSASSHPRSVVSTSGVNRPDDITSDDEGFSSDDEYTDDVVKARQQIRRDLVFGRPAPDLLLYKQKELIEMRWGYLKQLEEADEELEELTGNPSEVIVRRTDTDNKSGVDEATTKLNAMKVEEGDPITILRELRIKSKAEVWATDRQQLVEETVLLAQGLFRKERLIKSLLD